MYRGKQWTICPERHILAVKHFRPSTFPHSLQNCIPAQILFKILANHTTLSATIQFSKHCSSRTLTCPTPPTGSTNTNMLQVPFRTYSKSIFYVSPRRMGNHRCSEHSWHTRGVTLPHTVLWLFISPPSPFPLTSLIPKSIKKYYTIHSPVHHQQSDPFFCI